MRGIFCCPLFLKEVSQLEVKRGGVTRSERREPLLNRQRLRAAPGGASPLGAAGLEPLGLTLQGTELWFGARNVWAGLFLTHLIAFGRLERRMYWKTAYDSFHSFLVLNTTLSECTAWVSTKRTVALLHCYRTLMVFHTFMPISVQHLEQQWWM